MKFKLKTKKKFKFKKRRPSQLEVFSDMSSMFPKAKAQQVDPGVKIRKPFKLNTSGVRHYEVRWGKYGGGNAIDHNVTSSAKSLIEKYGFTLLRELPTRQKVYKGPHGSRLIVLTDINLTDTKRSIFRLELRVPCSPVSSSTSGKTTG